MISRRAVFVILIILAATVALAAAVVFAREGYLYEQIILPISYAFWIIGLLLRGTPQVLFWGILVIMALVLFMRSLVAAPQKPSSPQPLENTFSRRPRLRHWVRQLLMSRNERYRHYLKEGLGRLALEVLAYQRGQTVNQYQQQIDSEQVPAPEVIIPFLEARQGYFRSQQPLDLQQVQHWLRRLWNRLAFPPQAQPNQDEELAELVDFLEQQMDLE